MCRINSASCIRIVGTITLIACLVNALQFPGSLLRLYKGEDVSITLFLAVDEPEFQDMYANQIEKDLIVLELFCYLYAISSCFLIWASIESKYFFAIPWLFCAIIDVALQGYQLTRVFWPQNQNSTTWKIVGSVSSTFVSIVVTAFVLHTVLRWMKKVNDEEDTSNLSPTTPTKKYASGGRSDHSTITSPV